MGTKIPFTRGLPMLSLRCKLLGVAEENVILRFTRTAFLGWPATDSEDALIELMDPLSFCRILESLRAFAESVDSSRARNSKSSAYWSRQDCLLAMGLVGSDLVDPLMTILERRAEESMSSSMIIWC